MVKVSVCMATFNGKNFIKEQIESILKQLQHNDELIISDDSSNDGTIELLESIEDKRVIVLLNNTFRDPIRNFQNAISYAKGDYIFLSDQDDVWLENKYAKTCLLLEKYDLVVSNSIVTDENLNIIFPSFFIYFGSGKGILKNMIRSSYYGSCMAFRKSLLDYALPFPKTKEIGHDLWLGLVAEITGKVFFASEPFILYRRHIHSATPTGLGKSKRTFFQMLRGRIIMVKELILFYLKYLRSNLL